MAWSTLKLPTNSRQFDVLGLGECSLDEVWLAAPLRWGGKSQARARHRLGGGQVATAMAACARLGRRTSFAGAVGADAAGAEIRAGLLAEGVDVSGLAVVAGGASRAAMILVDAESGERTVLELCDPQLRPPRPSEALVRSARMIHLDATCPAVAIDAARAARQAGCLVSLDVDHPAERLDELLALSDIFFGSEGLAERLTGEPELPRALAALAARGGRLVGATLGRAGAALHLDGRFASAPGFRVSTVDTTACGDTFRAGFLCAILEGLDPEAALRFANAAAALKCRAIGRQGCPTRAEVACFLSAAPSTY